MTGSRYKYGLLTAVSMVVGGVIGSGVFFKAERINLITDGSVFAAVSAWGIGAAVMLMCLLAFALIAGKNGAEGICAISKNTLGEKYSYYAGWFMATVYYPSLVSVLAFLSARYTLIATGAEEKTFLCMLLSLFYLIITFMQNAFFPRLSGKVQIIATVLKLIPLALMIVLGISKGLQTELLFENISHRSSIPLGKSLFPATTATLFAYEGWIGATSVGRELKNSRKNLPLALITGGIVISVVYILYYLGVMGAVESAVLTNYGAEGIKVAFENILGKWGRLLTAFVAISCLGALNALVMGCGRAMYELSLSGRGPFPKLFSRKMDFGGMPLASFFAGLVISVIWIFYLFEIPFLRVIRFDSTELPVVSIYALYIPIFFKFALRERNIRSTVLCTGGICASAFAILCGVLAHAGEIISYSMVLFGVMLAGSLFYRKNGL